MKVIKDFTTFVNENIEKDNIGHSDVDTDIDNFDFDFDDEDGDIMPHKVRGTDDIIESLSDTDEVDDDDFSTIKHKIVTDDIIESYSELQDYELNDVFDMPEEDEEEEEE